MLFRKMEITDYDKVYSLWMKTPGLGLNDIDDSIDGIRRFLNRNPETCFVAENEGEINGSILAGHDGRRGYIYHTCVDVKFQNKHIGTMLVKNSLGALRKENITKVALVVFEKNIQGNRFWETLGFTARTDLVYRNLALIELTRIDT